MYSVQRFKPGYGDHRYLRLMACIAVFLCAAAVSSFAQITLQGVKFRDDNGNGIQDSGEPGISGWTIKARNTTSLLDYPVVTGVGGAFTLNVPNGTYHVREDQSAGYTQTAPGKVFYNNISASTSTLYFGNRPHCSGSSTSATLTQQKGDMDGFSIGGPPSNPAGSGFTGFLNAMNPMNSHNYDNTLNNRIFGETVGSLQVPSGCVLTGATVTIALRPLPGGVSNDDVIGFYQNGISVWEGEIRTLLGLPSWNSPSPGSTMTLDLANLAATPAGITNILAALQDGSLDIYVNDNTSVDYISVIVSYCCPNIGTLQGTKYNDANGNGIKDSGESGLSGWTIKAYNKTTGATATTTTDGSGNYSFPGLDMGDWIVYEVQQAGYTQTGPATAINTGTLSSNGQTISNLNFGNMTHCGSPSTTSKTGGINDLFAAGAAETSTIDGPLTSLMASLYSLSGITNQFDFSGTDKIFGHKFSSFLSTSCYATAGTLTIRLRANGSGSSDDIIGIAENGVSIWSATIASLNGGTWNPGTTQLFTIDLTNLPGSTVKNIVAALQDNDLEFYVYDDTGVDYAQLSVSYCCNVGNFSGKKFNDLNGNGVQDAGEPDLPGWKIKIQNGSYTDSATTDANGEFSFMNVPAGNWSVYEVQQTGWSQIAPLTVAHFFTLANGQTVTGLSFANKEICEEPGKDTIYGGTNDNFGGATENANQPGTLLSAITSIYGFAQTDDFDWSGQNAIFGHRFEGFLPDPGCRIVDAKLTIRLRGNLFGDVDNDRIGFIQNGVPIWSTAISTLNGGTWDSGMVQTFVIDLDNLTGTGIKNIIAALQDGDLDFYIQDDTGVDFANLEVSFCCTGLTIKGKKYSDDNHNGIQDAGEAGINNWEIRAYNPVTGDSISVFTDANGNYIFPDIDAGTWIVYEVHDPNYVQTAPAGVFYTVTGAAGDIDSGNVFGNTHLCEQPDSKEIMIGVEDDFNDGNTEIADADVLLINLMNDLLPGGHHSQFDDHQAESIFGHTLKTNIGSDCYVVDAQLELHLSTLSGHSDDDVIGFADNGVTIWEGRISDIVGYSWNNATDKIYLNLGALPGITVINILAALQDGSLGMYIHDNTMIDYIRFTVKYCCGGQEPNTIEGYKFEDSNGNGVMDGGESGISGFEIHAYNPVTGDDIVVYTDGSGYYSFSLPTGTWIIYEVQQAGRTQTAPASGIHILGLNYGQTISDRNFGNTPADYCDAPETVNLNYGQSDGFDPSNPEPADRSQELTELMDELYPAGPYADYDGQDLQSIFGQTVRDYLDHPGCLVYGATITLHLQAISGANSANDVIGIEKGGVSLWSAKISDLVGYTWTNTTGTVVLDLANLPGAGATNLIGALQGNSFGIYVYDGTSVDNIDVEIIYCCKEIPDPGNLEGVKYRDINGNGVRDLGEPGLAGWTIILRSSSGSLFYTTTDASGNYSFTGLPPGDWRIYEVQQNHWTQTEPTTVFHMATLNANQTINNLNFGNADSCENPTTYSIRHGVHDEFTQNGEEDYPVPPDMQTFMATYYMAGGTTSFDNPNVNKMFGHTFTGYLPAGCRIVGARLKVRVKPNGELSSNDRIGIVENGIPLWSASLASLTGSGWNGSTPYDITLDISNLPGGIINDFLAALQDNDFDFYIQDDTGIDYAELEVDYCCGATGKQGESSAPGQPDSYPNPFDTKTTISYTLSRADNVRISIHDIYGKLLKEFTMNGQGAGSHSVEWDGTDQRGAAVSNGLYIYSIEASGSTVTGSVILQK